jgi:seryl-tRNA synthetase
MNGTRDFEADAFLNEMRTQQSHCAEICHNLVEALRSYPTAARLVEKLNALANQLQQRLKREKQGGYLEEAASRLPRLQQDVTRILGQNAELLRQLETVAAELRVAVRQNRCCTPSLLAKLDHCLQELSQHEAAEREVVQQGFNTLLDDNA